MKMNGQWMGKAWVTTTNITDYFCVINLDLRGKFYEGRVMLFYLPSKVSIVLQVKIDKNNIDTNNGQFTGKLYNFLPLKSKNFTIGRWEEFSNISSPTLPSWEKKSTQARTG